MPHLPHALGLWKQPTEGVSKRTRHKVRTIAALPARISTLPSRHISDREHPYQPSGIGIIPTRFLCLT